MNGAFSSKVAGLDCLSQEAPQLGLQALEETLLLKLGCIRLYHNRRPLPIKRDTDLLPHRLLHYIRTGSRASTKNRRTAKLLRDALEPFAMFLDVRLVGRLLTDEGSRTGVQIGTIPGGQGGPGDWDLWHCEHLLRSAVAVAVQTNPSAVSQN